MLGNLIVAGRGMLMRKCISYSLVNTLKTPSSKAHLFSMWQVLWGSLHSQSE